MSYFANYAPHLPYLRRFGRVLTGRQASGDAYTMATLEAISADPDAPRTRNSGKRYLFSVFLKIWSTIPINCLPEPEPVAQRPVNAAIIAADRTLRAMTPMPRVAFLLYGLEGFTRNDIAGILNMPGDIVDELLEQAGQELTETLHTTVLIIEDDPDVAKDLEDIVNELGHQVIRVTRTRAEAVAALRDHKPGLVLADIRLADGGLDFDAVVDMLEAHAIPVIFMATHPDHLLPRENPEPFYLISTPFRPETVMAVVSQALLFGQRTTPISQAVRQ